MKNNIIINWSQIKEYEAIFGFNKLNDLWRDYLAQATQSWNAMDCASLDEKRLVFHSWRSSSQIFGMSAFADNCALIEEAILKNNNLDKLSEMIKQSQSSFFSGVAEINPYFKKMEV